MACAPKKVEDIEYCDGEHSLAGYYSEAYLILENDIAKFPKFASDKNLSDVEAEILDLNDPLTESAAELTLVGDITLKPGKKMTYFPILNDTGQLEYNRIKEISTAVKTDWSCDIQLSTHNEGVLSRVTRGILVLRELDGGRLKVLGRPKAPVVIAEEKGKNSRSADGSRMISLKFTHAPFRAADLLLPNGALTFPITLV